VFGLVRGRLSVAHVVAVVALVFAMSGGAYAASRYVITSTKQISPKVLASLKGKAGPSGPAGKVGPVGPAGPAGAGGSGSTGAAGSNGANGASVTGKEFVGVKGPCKEGGSELVGATGTTFACDGEKGAKGATGSPWTAGGTLPAGAMESGTWAATGPPDGPVILKGAVLTAISFGIPLVSAPKVDIIESGSGAGGGTCPASSSVEKPEAEEGNLCIFLSTGGRGAENLERLATLSPEEILEASGTMGTTLLLVPAAAEPVSAHGTWAVSGD
jgi:hypothetical protein